MSSRRFSYSRFSTFDQCPARYRMIYLDGRPKAGESIEAYLGSRLHETLEWLYRERSQSREVVFDALLQRYRELWREAWHAYIHIANPAWQTDDYYQLGQRSLAGFFRQHTPFDEPVEGIEHTISFEVPAGQQAVAEQPDEGYLMTAVLDRLDNHGAGWWSIHDYKSGKRMLTAANAQKDLQMKVYFLALTQSHQPVERVDVVWHYLRHGRELRLESVAWNPGRIATTVRNRIDKLRAAEADHSLFVPKESILCNWCYYWDICPAKQGQTHPARLAE